MSLLFERAGEREQPRVRIASVPYALKASDAETLGGLPASAYLRAPTAASAEGGSRETSTVTSAAVTATEAPSLAAVLPGTTNYLAKYVNGGGCWQFGGLRDADRQVPTGAVGIGTTAPLDALHLRFTNTEWGDHGAGGAEPGEHGHVVFGHVVLRPVWRARRSSRVLTTSRHEYRINNVATNASINFMTGSTSRFFVAPNGNIGIGTTSPSTNFDVSNALSTTVKADITASSYTAASSFGSGFTGRKARGTAAAPTAALIHDSISFFGGRGYGATGFGQDSGMHVRAGRELH